VSVLHPDGRKAISIGTLVAGSPALTEYSPSPLFALDVFGQAATVLHATLRTIGALIIRRVKYSREKIVLEDGGTIALDWVAQIRGADVVLQDSAPVVVVQHGICGSAESEYLIHVVEKLVNRGYRVVVLVARGCGGLDLTTPVPFSASRTSDLRHALSLVASRYPRARILALGFSLGAGITLRYLGEVADQTPLSGAVCISPYWNLLRPTAMMPVWGFVVGAAVKLYALIHREHFRDKLWDIMTSWEIGGIDKHLAPIHGHESVEAYYSAANPIASSARIQVPTLAVNAADDPLCNIDGCPIRRTASGELLPSDAMGPGLVCAIASTGGHLGFPEGWVPLDGSWTDRVCLQWFDAICNL
jgi:predicted alpha/beta-fold hydrolase